MSARIHRKAPMGIVVNQPASNIKFPDLLVQLNVVVGRRTRSRSRRSMTT